MKINEVTQNYKKYDEKFDDILVVDDTMKDSNHAYYLIIHEKNGAKKFVDLDDAGTLPTARKMAKKLGYEPKFWYKVSDKSVTSFFL